MLSFFLRPDLGFEIYPLIRAIYPWLLLSTLLLLLPHSFRFFCTEKWNGYFESSPWRDKFHRPAVIAFIYAVWIACASCLILNYQTVIAAGINLALCYYFFIATRWKSISRGLGAPGYFTYWPGAAIFLLELTAQDPEMKALVLAVLRIDFAVIFISSGFYKFMCGYFKNEGMEYGLVNPEWSYWWKSFRKLPPRHPFFAFLDQTAWSLQVLAGILILIPGTRVLGVFVLLGVFAVIPFKIRLGTLCPQIIGGAFLMLEPSAPLRLFSPGVSFLKIFLNAHLFLVPLCHLALSYNFYFKKQLPKILQTALNFYANIFGLIVWRVFSSDLINFYPNIYRQPKSGGGKTLVSEYGWKGFKPNRFNHVCEAITITSLFTALKYYASNADLFRQRLMRYAKTLPLAADSVFIFEYISIQKIENRFAFVPVCEYRVDTAQNQIQEKILDSSFNVHAPAKHSLIHEGHTPGIYVPAEKK